MIITARGKFSCLTILKTYEPGFCFVAISIHRVYPVNYLFFIKNVLNLGLISMVIRIK